MRVTNKMLSNSFLRDMRVNLESMKTLQQQMTSGKEIRKPSDDPFRVARTMQLHSDINANKQYNTNIVDTINWLDTTDTAIGQLGNSLQRIRELLVGTGNGAYSDNERKAIKDEINEKIGEMAQILNTNFDGQYVFGGTRGTSKPTTSYKDANGNTVLAYVQRDGITPLDPAVPEQYAQLGMIGSVSAPPNTSVRKVEVSQGVIMDYNVAAGSVLEFKNEKGESIDLRNTLAKIVNHFDGKTDDGSAVDDNAYSKLNNGDLQEITDTITNLLRIRSEVGAKQNRMDSAKNKNEDQNFNFTEILSHTEDIDITEKTMEYATMQTVYMASLQTSARVIQPSLIDYLR